ncbi:conserved Plasmodium protein, unknown function [Plasmodium gallinaceum]|uniref:Uncharacterized protein n=1 Tax=Plasmodium gallinaceum TaxID=5849 RepID=A0A1J1GWT5_PLAGA|nr:conserved Plasmodium protein, unknown function [Plasmodium gallinaceum]CRG97001.1 conserved Plasmodium protein, unknown function [Plasmodium gallinaceum]
MSILVVILPLFLFLIHQIKYFSSNGEIFKKRMLNPFQYKNEKKHIMKHVQSLSYIFNELKNNVEDLENTYNNFKEAIKVSDETEKRIININNEKTNKFIEKMEKLKTKYGIFKEKIEDNLDKKKKIFDKILKNTIKEFFNPSVRELKGINKYIRYINLNAKNLNKIISGIFSKAISISDIYEQNINEIFEIGKEYYRMKLKILSNFFMSEYNEYNKKLRLISNEKHMNEISDIFYIEVLKDYLLNSKKKINMIDMSIFLESHSFLELSYFFNTFLKNYCKSFIIYVINRVEMNSYNNQMIFLESNKVVDIVNFIKKNYNHLNIDYVVINIFNTYISVFVNSNGILYHVNYEDYFCTGSLILYNTHNYGYFFTNQKIDYNKFNSDDEYLFVLYLGNRKIEDNFLIYNRKDMIKFKKVNVLKLLENKKFNSYDSFLNMYLLKLESEYNFYKQFLNDDLENIHKFSVYNSNIIITHNSLSKFDIPNDKFTPHFKDIYILIIIYPGSYLDTLCDYFTNFLFRESIFILKKEDSNILEIYFGQNKATFLINNKNINYHINVNEENNSDSSGNKLTKISNCIKFYMQRNYNEYFDYLQIIYFIVSD